MIILNKDEIKKLFSMQEAILANKQAFELHAQGKSIVPLRTNIDMPNNNGQSLFMPAYLDEINALGIKIVSVFPNNITLNKPSVPAQMILLDGLTGEVSAIIDGTYLTQLRTGAMQGLATDLLAREDAKIALLIGTGGQAITQLQAMLTVRALTTVQVFDIDGLRAQQFVSKAQTEFSAFASKIVAVTDIDAAVKCADIITTVTTSKKPVFDGCLVKCGTHINGIGAYTPEMQELPESIIKLADKIVFDTNEGVLAEAGDIIMPMKAGSVTKADFTGDLGSLLLGQIKAREHHDEITVFKAVGSALLDVVVAHQIYQKALKQKVGREIAI